MRRLPVAALHARRPSSPFGDRSPLAAVAAFVAVVASGCAAPAPSRSVAVAASGLERVWIEALGME